MIAKAKGGLTVDIGLKAFLPGSQIDLRPIRKLEKLISYCQDTMAEPII